MIIDVLTKTLSTPWTRRSCQREWTVGRQGLSTHGEAKGGEVADAYHGQKRC